MYKLTFINMNFLLRRTTRRMENSERIYNLQSAKQFTIRTERMWNSNWHEIPKKKWK